MGKAMKAMSAMKAMKAMSSMRAMKGGAPMSKGGLAEALAAKTDLKKAVCSKLIGALADVGAKEVKSTGVFTVHGLCRIKTKVKPATKAGKKMMFETKHLSCSARWGFVCVDQFPSS